MIQHWSGCPTDSASSHLISPRWSAHAFHGPRESLHAPALFQEMFRHHPFGNQLSRHTVPLRWNSGSLNAVLGTMQKGFRFPTAQLHRLCSCKSWVGLHVHGHRECVGFDLALLHPGHLSGVVWCVSCSNRRFQWGTGSFILFPSSCTSCLRAPGTCTRASSRLTCTRLV